jgi:hypothetical protein
MIGRDLVEKWAAALLLVSITGRRSSRSGLSTDRYCRAAD